METRPSNGLRVLVNAQREAIFGEESVNIRKVKLNDGDRVGVMTGLTLAGFCEVNMEKLDGLNHWYPIGDLTGENGEKIVEEEIHIELADGDSEESAEEAE